MPPKNSEVNKALLNSLVGTFCLALVFLIPVLSDIRSGALSGEPETGWGIMFAILFFGPALLISSVYSLLKIKRLKSDGYNIGYTVKKALIITVVIILVVGTYSFIQR